MKNMKLKVLSLFDGMSCGQIALERADIKVKKYYASEIDKYAIQVTQNNYPKTMQLGSVIDLKKKHLKKLKVDILIGGSPCQGFSISGKLKGSATKCGVDVTTLKQYLKLKKEGFEFDGQSYLFWEYVRVWKIVKPKYFFLENVRVTKKWLPMFNEAMGVEPIMINSALVSAQNRVRYYWTNIPNLTHPEDKGILLKDVIEDGMAGNGNMLINLRPCTIRESKNDSICKHVADADDINGHDILKRVYSDEGKSPTLNTCTGGNREVKVLTSDITYRKLTPLECERLQTVSDNYTNHVSNSQRYKMLGNGWTIDVITHIFKGLNNV